MKQNYEKNGYFYDKLQLFQNCFSMQGDTKISEDTSHQSGLSLSGYSQNIGLIDSLRTSDTCLLITDSIARIKRPLETMTPVVVYPARHEGVLRPTSFISESFLFALLLLVILLLNRIIRSGPRFLYELIRGILTLEERSFARESMLKRNMPLFWLINISFIALSVKVCIEQFGIQPALQNGWLFWKLAAYTAVFLLVKHFLYWLIGSVFFKADIMQRWLMGNQVIVSLFSFSLLPFLVLYEVGVVFPPFVLVGWPLLCLALPKVVYTFKSMKIFLVENGGYFYMILYLCALEILPLLLYLKGLFLLK